MGGILMDLSKQTITKIDNLIPQYPKKRSAVLPLLHLVQEEKGFLDNAAVEWIANRLDLEPINVWELVTFYPMLRTKPAGKLHIKVCRTLSCALKGSYKLCENLEQITGCPLGKTTEDGRFTLEFVECLASCGTAPVVQVNETLYENVNLDKTDEFLQKILNKERSL